MHGPEYVGLLIRTEPGTTKATVDAGAESLIEDIERLPWVWSVVRDDPPPRKSTKCEQWLRRLMDAWAEADELPRQEVAVARHTIFDVAHPAFSLHQLRTARENSGITSKRQDFSGAYYWSPPAHWPTRASGHQGIGG